LPQAYVGIYPKGNLSWHHLWFVAYMLILTFVLLPVYLWARATGLHWLMAVPLAASIIVLSPISHNVNGLICAGLVRPRPRVRRLFGLKPLMAKPAALPASTTGL
jgi:hypothetical protein